MLRIATLDDVDAIEKMAAMFVQATGYSKYAHGKDITNLIVHLITDKDSIVLVYEEDGMIAGTLGKFPFGPYIVASEIAWWVNPNKRKSTLGTELLDAFEYWAKTIGADMIHMVSLDDSVGKVYEKKGYTLFERAYMKEL